MERIYSEADITWSSIEKYINYNSVIWSLDKNDIPKYAFIGEDGRKIDINESKFK